MTRYDTKVLKLYVGNVDKDGIVSTYATQHEMSNPDEVTLPRTLLHRNNSGAEQARILRPDRLHG